MAINARVTLYRDELILGYEKRQSLLRGSVTTEAQIKGNSAVFLIGDSGGAVAVTRGSDGLIPYYSNNNTQQTCTLTEQHAPFRQTNFNLFANQGDQRKLMQINSMAVINRKVDDQITDELANATQYVNSTATTASLALIMKGLAILGQNKVPLDDNVYAIISMGFYAYLMQQPSFTSADFQSYKPLTQGMGTMFSWAGVKFIVHNDLPNQGTASELCYLYHKTAIGHAMDVKGMDVRADYNEEHDYSWSRSTFYGGAKLLQSSGVVIFRHDSSAFAATT